MTPYQRLIDLEKFIQQQINIETIRPSYNGTQRAIAYRRVQQRLKPILEEARFVAEALNFEDLGNLPDVVLQPAFKHRSAPPAGIWLRFWWVLQRAWRRSAVTQCFQRFTGKSVR